MSTARYEAAAESPLSELLAGMSAKLEELHKRELRKAVVPLEEENRILKDQVKELQRKLAQGAPQKTATGDEHPHTAAVERQALVTSGASDGKAKILRSGTLASRPAAEHLPSERHRPSEKRLSTTSANSDKGGWMYNLDNKVQELDTSFMMKHRTRLAKTLKIDTCEDNCIGPKHLQETLNKRSAEQYDLNELTQFIAELYEIAKTNPNVPVDYRQEMMLSCDLEDQKDPKIRKDVFITLVIQKDLPDLVSPSLRHQVVELQKRILTPAADEVAAKNIMSVATHHFHAATNANCGLIPVVNAVVAVTIVCSVTCLGYSLDHSPDWTGWTVCEGIFATVFIGEFLIKVSVLTCRGYFCGPDAVWNWLDFAVSTLAVIEFFVKLGAQETTGARIVAILRALRMARMVRLFKLLHNPWMKDLTNMISGLVIGAPWLFWVSVLLGVVIFMFGIGFREAVGPEPGQDLQSVCGSGDYPDKFPEELGKFLGREVSYEESVTTCKPYLLYGEEYFGTVMDSMFTVFRCMIGDCTTKTGQSLAVHLGQGYGARFYCVYTAGMICVIFCLFNVVTALFIESTLTGLRFDDEKRKQARMNESRYLERKLSALVDRIRSILIDAQDESLNNFSNSPATSIDTMPFDLDVFRVIMHDPQVNVLLDELDVTHGNRTGLFDMVDTEGDGVIILPDLIETLLKLRGAPQKSDVIASWVALRSLTEKFETFELLLLANQKKMMANQRLIDSHIMQQTRALQDQEDTAAPIGGDSVLV